MKAYVCFKFKEDYNDRPFIENICKSIEDAGLETFVLVRDSENWGQTNLAHDQLMPSAFKALDECDITIIEFSEKGVGLGIEAGYAYAKGKPIIVVAKEGTVISETMRGVATQIITYRQPEDITEALKSSAIMGA